MKRRREGDATGERPLQLKYFNSARKLECAHCNLLPGATHPIGSSRSKCIPLLPVVGYLLLPWRTSTIHTTSYGNLRPSYIMPPLKNPLCRVYIAPFQGRGRSSNSAVLMTLPHPSRTFLTCQTAQLSLSLTQGRHPLCRY